MTNLIPYIIIFFLIASCQSSNNELTRDTNGFLYYKYNDGVLSLDSGNSTKISGNYYALSKRNGGGVHMNDFDVTQVSPQIINVALYWDSNINSNTNITAEYEAEKNTINTILKNLNIGYQIELEVRTKNLDNINTKGGRNKENVFKDLDIEFSEDSTYVLLFDEGDFFSTASAICMFNGDVPVIFGDADLMKSPMIFIHELGHSFGLTHSNTKIEKNGCIKRREKDCVAFNFMHESNIGCSYHITNRQILIAKDDQYIPEIINDITNTDTCSCNRANLDNIVEGYINSLDRNIDDTPVVGNFDKFFETNYKNELLTGDLDSTIEVGLRSNYGREFDVLVKVGNKTAYVEKRLEVHKELRKNNLARWLEHYAEDQGVEILSGQSFYTGDSLFYDSILAKLDTDIVCQSIMNELIAKHIEIQLLKKKLDSSGIAMECFIETVDNFSKSPSQAELQGRPENNNNKRELINFLRRFSEKWD
jgi:hypothetical protein